VIALGQRVEGSVAQGQSLFYRFDVAAGQTVRVNLEGSHDLISTRIYVRTIPCLPQGFRFRDIFCRFTNEEVIIPSSSDGAYFVMIVADQVSNVTADFSIIAEVVPFSVRSISTQVGGNVGTVTVRVSGAQFRSFNRA